MRRIVNLRTMFFVALGETTVLLCMYTMTFSFVGGLSAICLAAVALVVGFVLCLRAGRKNLLVAILLTAVFGTISAVVFAAGQATYYSITPSPEATYGIAGTVESVSTRDGYVQSLVLKDVRVGDRNIRGKVRVYLEESDVDEREIPAGYRLTTSGKLYKIALIDGKRVNGTAYRQNMRYTAYVTFAQSKIDTAKTSGLARLRVSMYSALRTACGDTYGSIAYCMLTGDRDALQSDETQLYTIAGIGHVLAVSGLHVGLICAVLLFLMRRLHVPKKIYAVVVCLILCGYAVFVGLSASVVRATVMSVIVLLTLLHGERVDPLNSLSLAYAGILLFEPFLLFEVGFAMSFGAVFGLTLFSASFTRALRRIRICKPIASALAATVSVHIGILPVSIYYFGAVGTYSMLFNLLLLPIITATFVGFVFLLPVCMLFGLSMPLRLCAVGFAFVDTVVGFAPHLPFAEISVLSHPAVFLLYPLYFFGSRFVMLGKAKPYVSLVSAVLCVVSVVVPAAAMFSVPTTIHDAMLCVDAHGEVTTIFVEKGNVTVIGDVRNTAVLERTMRAYGIRRIDTMVLHRLTPDAGASLAGFVREREVGRILCPADNIDASGLAKLGKYKRFYAYEEAPLSYVQAVGEGKHVGFVYTFACGVRVLATGYSSRYTDVPVAVLDETPIVRCAMYLNRYPDRMYLTNLPKGFLGELPRTQISLASEGGYAFKVTTGEVLKTT